MLSNLDAKSDPHDVLEIAPDVVLVARAAAEFPSLAPESVSQPSDRQPNMGTGAAAAMAAPRVDTTFRATDVNEIPRIRSARGRWVRTASMAFAFAFVSVVATAAWERYGDQAQAMVAGFTPQLDLASWLPWQRNTVAAQADAPAGPSVAADQAAAAPALPADGAAAGAGAAAPPQNTAQDTAQSLQGVSRDVASLTQEIETLKASIAELKASQEQLSRDMAKPREAKAPEPKITEAKPVEPRPTKLGAPPRSLGTVVQHKPKPPMYPPMQASTGAPLPPPNTAPPPVQIAPAPMSGASTSPDDVVVRPPMPVR
jgi:hypothetical protein